MNTRIANIIETKGSVKALVKKGGIILRTHKFDKTRWIHSFTEADNQSFTDDEVSEISNQSRELIKCHLT